MFRRSKDDDSTVKDKAKEAAKVALAGKVAKEAVTSDEEEDTSGGKGKFVVLLLAGAGALGYALKKRREKERDETLWQEPRPL
ncbi:MAG: hypothetical protein KY462_00995 [Actinobacteria bacterium]|nr:hypothetical protein [Actinomycetota bacterium]